MQFYHQMDIYCPELHQWLHSHGGWAGSILGTPGVDEKSVGAHGVPDPCQVGCAAGGYGGEGGENYQHH